MSSKWNPKKYRDDYREALMEVIEEKVEAGGKEIEEKPKSKPRPSTKVIDLVSVLQESLNKTKKSHHAAQEFSRNATPKGRVIVSVLAADSTGHTRYPDFGGRRFRFLTVAAGIVDPGRSWHFNF